ncbi:helix-turn-helix transcriptional regulator [Candidatus Saccharibacteria bacterium]|jgi:DNA-binding XRE family transcriptional regulator|nr:helix-turn-helix transcriptional regulator [Candidatus Saccharibacteria bacterium]
MPFAESSPVRRARQNLGWTQRYLAKVTGLSPSTIGVIERLRNPNWVLELERQNLKSSLTTLEVAVRICAALGALEYGRSYTVKEVARKSKMLFTEQGLTDRTRRLKQSYPDQERHLRAVA